MTQPLSALLESLHRAGLDIDAEAALDSVWLALRMNERQSQPDHTRTDDTTGGRGGGTSSVGGDARTPDGQGVDASRLDRPAAPDLDRPLILPPVDATDARAITLARASALRDRRDIIKALRPLRRRVVSPGSGTLDLDATVRRAAEEDLWIPSFQPARERWLDVLLVADHSRSMIIWKETIDEFERVLHASGAFRSVRSWWLESDADTLAVSARRRGRSPATPEGLTRLVHSASRSVILVMSDCTAARWHDGEVPRLIARWSQMVPVALMQVTPEWFWARTALGDTVGSRFRSPVPAAVNRQFSWDASSFGVSGVSRELERDLLRVPAAALTPDAVARVAGLIAGVGRDWAPGVVFDLTWAGEERESVSVTPSDRVARFLALASKDAARLAAAFAASPVRTLGVLRLLRNDLMPAASPFTEAEVLLGGIVRVRLEDASWDLGASLPLEFFPGVQRLVLDGALAADVVRALTRAAQVAASGVGETFTTWLESPTSAAAQLDPAESAFAAGAAQALARLGGAYARIVKPAPAPRPERTGAQQSASADETTPPVQPAETLSGSESPEREPITLGDEDDILTKEFLVSGRVSGVGFRSFVQRQSVDLGLEGSADNLPDGRIRVIATGARHLLDGLENQLRRGPPGARVDRVDARVIEPEPAPQPASPPRTEKLAWPFWELMVDEDGKIESPGVGSIARAVSDGIDDLFVLIHGWNVDRPAARHTYSRLLDTMERVGDPSFVSSGKIAALGLFWPSVLWGDDDDEPDLRIPRRVGNLSAEEGRRLEDATKSVTDDPDDPRARDRLDDLMRDVGARGEQEASGSVSSEFGSSVSNAEESQGRGGRARSERRGALGALWESAKNTLRVTTFYQMKKRAGVVGREGLGPFLAELAEIAPHLRIHLIAHSVGARLATHALTAIADRGSRTPEPVASLSLLQGIMSHNAFAARPRGAHADALTQVKGPVVVTYSRQDNAAGVAYNMLSRIAGRDEDSPREDAKDRGALGYDGAQGIPAVHVALGPVGIRYRLASHRVYNVDVSERLDGHAGIFAPEIGWLILSAAGPGNGGAIPVP